MFCWENFRIFVPKVRVISVGGRVLRKVIILYFAKARFMEKKLYQESEELNKHVVQEGEVAYRHMASVELVKTKREVLMRECLSLEESKKRVLKQVYHRFHS